MKYTWDASDQQMFILKYYQQYNIYFYIYI